ncbi:O-antigen/teichoic acid export membrane protein [Melghiribacillus thermohalophilus]|uniref:O-antigen/teichoic acid export membrane protein n=1 Tax=Melghiribacillus thermohalophilus TaxID=1324956 RepID=A0A4R3NAH8_9BACI|nr:oligosaccharide flippase family protein [Melghiribacillus thermohalophilus]TCT26462.1 O-antigen/teichoic acid export membrane protein [Melghiribacillus thermohalophilus]
MYLKKTLKKNIFLRNSILYILGGIVTPLVGFLMLPIYTYYLSPSEYAIMTTVQTLVGLFEIFLIFSLKGAITRFYYDFKDQTIKQREYLGSILLFSILLSSCIAVVLIYFYEFIGGILFNNIPVFPFYFYLIGISWASALLSIPMALFRVQEKAGLFVLINTVKAALIMLLTIYLIIGKGLGAESALISQLLFTSILLIFSYILQYKSFKFKINLNFVKQSLKYSIPMMPHVASVWIINSSDRIILEKFVDLNDLGVYSLAVQISMVLALFYTSVNNAFVPRYMRLRTEEKQAEAEKLLKIFFYIVLVFGLISIPVAMFGLKLISSSGFYGPILLLPSLLIAQIIKGFYYIPVAKILYEKKTKSIATSSSLSAMINVIISLILIPVIGIFGAVCSTIVSESVRLLLMLKASKR